MNALYIISGLGILTMVAEIANLKKGLLLFILAGLAAAGVFAVLDWNTSQSYYSDMLRFDNFSLAFTLLLVIVTMLWMLTSQDYFSHTSNKVDRFALVLFSLAGAVVMVSFSNMAMLFLGIEILSISLYALAGSRKNRLSSNEASFKYFLMGSFASAFLLLGISLVYGTVGSFNLSEIGQRISEDSASLPTFFHAGVLLMLVGLTFKVSAVPFHFWAPDVYEGSPVPVTAFMATVVKVAAIASFYKIFVLFEPVQSTWWTVVIAIVVLTLIVANVTAVFQTHVKRMLAYSSVSQAGYILLAFAVATSASRGTIFYYLAGYCVSTLAAFAILQRVGEQEQLKGLFKRSPLLAVVMTVALLSLAGIPPLAGFFGKYFVFLLALNNGYTGLVLLAVATSLIGAFYYLRVIITIFSSGADTAVSLSLSDRLFLTILLFLVFLLGLFPEKLVTLLL